MAAGHDERGDGHAQQTVFWRLGLVLVGLLAALVLVVLASVAGLVGLVTITSSEIGPGTAPEPIVTLEPPPATVGAPAAAPTVTETELPLAARAVVAAVLDGDIKTLVGMVGYTEVECWAGDMGAGAPPSCALLGLRPGTWIQTLPVSSCEGSFAPKWEVPGVLDALLAGKRQPLQLVGVLEPTAHPFGATYEAPEYGLVFDSLDGTARRVVYLHGERIVMVEARCG